VPLDREDEGERGQRLLAAAHRVEPLDRLVGGLGLHRQPLLERVLGVLQEELAAAGREAREDVLELVVDRLERLHERPLLFGLVPLDTLRDRVALLDEDVPALLERLQRLLYLVVFVDREHVDGL